MICFVSLDFLTAERGQIYIYFIINCSSVVQFYNGLFETTCKKTKMKLMKMYVFAIYYKL